ncbi:MAG: hypothetical protein U9R53_02910 [Chloroflexota bacterium]|nr:hypothetical protein [Chloroflexota bacterium]
MNNRVFNRKCIAHIAVIAGISLALGSAFQGVLSVGEFLPGFLAASLLIFICGVVLYLAWRIAGGGKALAWMMIAAFVLRLAIGVFFAWGLPRFGYDEDPQNAGFVFEDAYRREADAWYLAKSDAPLTRAFSDEFQTDQYGGMLAMSALVYRTISPDAYRPALISIIMAGVMTLSLPFLMSALKQKFDKSVSLWAGWILALYPEGILLGAAQLREPFFILLFTIMFWASVNILDRKKLKISILAILISTLCLFLFSFRIGIPILGVMLLLMWVEFSSQMKRLWVKIAGWVMIFLALAAILWLLWYWVDAVLWWDTLVTIRTSNRVQLHIEALPQWLHFPFILIYGIFQPVLPAAIAAPAPWIWRALGIFRALGWYALLPLLAYALISIWRLKASKKRQLLIIIALLVWLWVIIASARAGGDQWDNPRYRTIFLPWIGVVAGWAITFARKTKDRWLMRSLVVEGIFLAFFTNWYISRYNPTIPRLEFYASVILIIILSLVVIIIGLLRDRHWPKKGFQDRPGD